MSAFNFFYSKIRLIMSILGLLAQKIGRPLNLKKTHQIFWKLLLQPVGLIRTLGHWSCIRSSVPVKRKDNTIIIFPNSRSRQMRQIRVQIKPRHESKLGLGSCSSPGDVINLQYWSCCIKHKVAKVTEKNTKMPSEVTRYNATIAKLYTFHTKLFTVRLAPH